MTTSAMPHQRRAEIASPKKNQQPSGTRISTTRDSGKAMVSGIYLRTWSQLMKLTITKIMPDQTSGEASPVTPVHDQACAGFAVSDAPRLSSSSETNTHTTLSASCNHGLAKPEGRSRISYRYQRCTRQERI